MNDAPVVKHSKLSSAKQCFFLAVCVAKVASLVFWGLVLCWLAFNKTDYLLKNEALTLSRRLELRLAVKNVATADDGRRLLNVEITATNESGMTIIIDQVSIRNPIICVFDSGGRMTEATRTGFVSLGSQSGEATSYESLEDGGSVTLDLPITIERALDGDTVITNLTHSWTLKRGKDYTLVAIVESLVDSPLFRKGVPVSALSIRKATGNPVMGLSVSSPIIVSEKHLSELDKGMQGQSDKAIWK